MNTSIEQAQISTEAAEWLLRLEENRGPQTHAEFVAWLKRSPRHMDEFLMVEAAYRSVQQFDPKGRIDLEALIKSASAEIVPLKGSRVGSSEPSTSRNRPNAVSQSRTRFWASAAAVGLLVVGAIVFAAYAAHRQTFATAVGEQRVFKLADGSLMHLNTQSQAEIHFSSRAREVRLLQGEALFTVRHDATRPFRVWTDTAVVQAVGTAFNVYQRADDSTVVSVVEGRVKVTAQSDRNARFPALISGTRKGGEPLPIATPLVAGEEVNILRDGRVVKQAAADLDQAVSWRQRRLVFRETPLTEVVTQFNRYNNDIQLQVDSGRLAQRRITGTFDADEPRAFIKFLEQDPDVELDRRANEVVVRSREYPD